MVTALEVWLSLVVIFCVAQAMRSPAAQYSRFLEC